MSKILIATPDSQDIRDMTAEEQALLDATVVETTEKQQAEADAKVAQDAVDAQTAIDKASAKAKLIAGEALTEDEANTIVI